MNAKNQALFWAGFTVLFILTIIVFKSVLLPFVLGMTIAYLLNPTVHYLGKTGLSRTPATMLILCAFILFVLGFLALVSPVIYQELVKLSKDLPGYVDHILALIEPLSRYLMIGGDGDGQLELKNIITEHTGSALNVMQGVWGGLAAGGQAIAGFFSLLVITPIVAFFMMVEWPYITNWCKDLFPREHEKTIMNLLKEIDKKLSGFIRGQISVAFILGVGYAVALTLAGLKYGILIGLGAGILSIIPMVGSTIGLVVSVGVAWFQSGEWEFVALIGGIFIGGQLLEGNFLTPKLVGKSVGLHPLWVFFALIAGGSLFGILGMLIAVPVAAVVSVLLAFAIHKYKQSALYKGPAKPAAKKTPAKKTKTKPWPAKSKAKTKSAAKTASKPVAKTKSKTQTKPANKKNPKPRGANTR